MPTKRDDVLLQGLFLLTLVAIALKIWHLKSFLANPLHRIMDLLYKVKNLMLGIILRVCSSSSALNVIIVLSLVIIIISIAVWVARKKRNRQQQACFYWNLLLNDPKKAERSLRAIEDMLADKTMVWGTRAFVMLGLKEGKRTLSVIVENTDKVPVEFVERFIRALEPEVEVTGKGIIKCPDTRLETPEPEIKEKREAPSLSPFVGSSLSFSKRNENHSDTLYFACSVESNPPSPLGIRLSDVWRHIGIFGSTGSGKTTTAAILSLLLYKAGYPVVILDWHGEYSALLRNVRELSVLDPLNADVSFNPISADIESTINILEDVFDFSQPQSAVMYRMLKTYSNRISGLHDLLYLLESRVDEGYWERELRQALVRKLEFIDSKEGRKIISKGKAYRPPSSGLQVIDLSNVRNMSLRRIVGLVAVREIYREALESDHLRSDRLILVIDEAQNLLPREHDNFIARMLAEVRKYGVAFIISTQSPSSINMEFLKNINTKVIHAIRTGIDKRVLVDSTDISEELASRVGFLKPGEAILSTPSIGRPVLVRICNELLLGEALKC